jgi:outer membrane protein TolC
MELIKLTFFDYLTSCWQIGIQDEKQALHHEYTQWLHSQAAQGAIDDRLLLDADLEARKLRRKYEQQQWRQKQAAAKINLLVGQPPDIPVPAPRGLQIWTRFHDGDFLQSRALECRTELQILQARVQSAEHRVDLMKRAFFPDFQPMIRFDTIDRNRGTESLTTLVGFNVYAPIAIKRRKGALHEAEADLVRVRAELRQRTAELRHAVHIASGHLNEAYAALQYSFSTIKLAEQDAQSVHQRFENGHAGFDEVRSTQQRLLEERSEQCSAYLDYYQRLILLERTTGVPLLTGQETPEATE